MKFSIALGLLFAGLTYSQQVEPVKLQVDNFLRQNQHLNSNVQLISIKQNGQLSTVTYKDGPVNMKFNVRHENDQMKIVGIQKMVSFSQNLQLEPFTQQNTPQQKLQPLPLIMPHWSIQENGSVSSQNVFDQVQKQIAEMEKKMQQDQKIFQNMMEKKRIQMKQRFNKNFQTALKETPLLGGDDHDYNQATNIQFDQPIIGGDHDYNWATQTQNADIPLIGGGDHDLNWATIQFILNQPLIGGGDHDFVWQITQDHPLIGGDDHDNWQEKKKGKHHKNKHRMNGHKNKGWKGKHHQGKQKMHHTNAFWMLRQFTNDEVTPYLNQKLPDLMKDGEVVQVFNNGFQKGKGFRLQIQVRQKQGTIKNVQALFKPRKHEFLINKIQTVEKAQPHLQLGKQLVSKIIQKTQFNMIPPVQIEAKPENLKKEEIQNEHLIPSQIISQNEKPSLLGGSSDPDHQADFFNIAQEIEFKQDNHINNHIIPQNKQEQVLHVPLLGGQHDFNHIPVQQQTLLGGQHDMKHNIQQNQEQQKKTVVEQPIKKTEQTFDVSGLPLPGGQTDVDNHKVDHSIGFEFINKILAKAADLFEDQIQDIEEQQPKNQPKEQELQLLIK